MQPMLQCHGEQILKCQQQLNLIPGSVQRMPAAKQKLYARGTTDRYCISSSISSNSSDVRGILRLATQLSRLIQINLR